MVSPFYSLTELGVGYGARSYADGIDAVYYVAQENYPAEMLELTYPVRLANLRRSIVTRAVPGVGVAAVGSSGNLKYWLNKPRLRFGSMESINRLGAYSGGKNGGVGPRRGQSGYGFRTRS